MKLSSRIENVTFPPISEVKSWVAQRTFSAARPLVDLCQAIPDYPPAPALVEYLHTQLADPTLVVYSADEGLLEVRQELCAWYGRHYHATLQPDQLCLTIGASQAFWLAMLVLCQSGDEVVVPLPAYFDHPMALAALGIVPRFVAFNGTTGLPDVAEIAAAITPRTRAILVVTPSNPTGAVLPPALLAELFELARDHDIALVVDETYNAFLPCGQPAHHLFSNADWGQHFIQIASFGKTFALTGYRAGALVAASQLIHHALKVQDSMVVCQPRITQRAVAYGCRHLDSWVADKAEQMQQRHDLFRRLFDVPENSFTLCASGAFFGWVRHPWPQLTGRQAARKLADEANVLCLPGEVFGPGLDSYLRLAFGNLPVARVPSAVERFLALK